MSAMAEKPNTDFLQSVLEKLPVETGGDPLQV